ncbi:MAG: CAP domain-containing protein [bacterium]|nr:CAP domain-containing protein [bacterium]
MNCKPLIIRGIITLSLLLFVAGVFSAFDVYSATAKKQPAPKKISVSVKKKPAPKKIVVPTKKVSVKKQVPVAFRPPTLPKPAEPHTIIIIPSSSELLPSPLIVSPPQSQEGILTHDGVVAWTNIQRKNTENLPALVNNAKLDAIAELRLKDMFAKQYFEHVAPDGGSATTAAKDVGYDMILLGENIALGDFGTDQKLVQAWMDSPHHRENILNTRYSEIGIAVGKNTYEGRSTWIGVQIFGLPLSACTQPDENLKNTINQLQTQIETEQKSLIQKKAALEALHPSSQNEVDRYNQLVRTYNDLVAHVNQLAAKLKEAVATFNTEVHAFNTCAQGS